MPMKMTVTQNICRQYGKRDPAILSKKGVANMVPDSQALFWTIVMVNINKEFIFLVNAIFQGLISVYRNIVQDSTCTNNLANFLRGHS